MTSMSSAGPSLAIATTKTCVSKPKEKDVLLGRGAHINKHPGNVRFRKMILAKNAQYMTCTTNYEKDLVARQIGAAVISHGGRFLRNVAKEESAEKVWEVVSERAALGKVKQAIRDNARLHAAVRLRASVAGAAAPPAPSQPAQAPSFASANHQSLPVAVDSRRGISQPSTGHLVQRFAEQQSMTAAVGVGLSTQGQLIAQAHLQQVFGGLHNSPAMDITSAPRMILKQCLPNSGNVGIGRGQLRQESLEQQLRQKRAQNEQALSLMLGQQRPSLPPQFERERQHLNLTTQALSTSGLDQPSSSQGNAITQALIRACNNVGVGNEYNLALLRLRHLRGSDHYLSINQEPAQETFWDNRQLSPQLQFVHSSGRGLHNQYLAPIPLLLDRPQNTSTRVLDQGVNTIPLLFLPTNGRGTASSIPTMNVAQLGAGQATAHDSA